MSPAGQKLLTVCQWSLKNCEQSGMNWCLHQMQLLYIMEETTGLYKLVAGHGIIFSALLHASAFESVLS